MFFILSKVLFFLIQPINWVVGLMVFALVSKNEKWKKRALLWSVILTLFFSNQFVFNEVVRIWETETIKMNEIEEPYDIGILLGGYSSSLVIPNDDRQNFNARGNRFMNAFELYKSGKVKKLLLTGGSGRILDEEWSEALSMDKFFKKIGVPEKDYIIEPNSRNTYENAVFTAEIIKKKYPNARCLLITSAWHMPRSKGCFKKQNLKFTPFSVDHLSEKRRFHPEALIIPSRLGFYRWEVLIKEWVGCLFYWIKGYI